MPTLQKIEVCRGDSKTLAVTITGADGSQLDMAGLTAKWWVAKSYKSYDDEVLIRKSTDDGGIVLTDTGVEIFVETADTDIDSDHYYHELKIFGGSDVATVMNGEFVVTDVMDMVEPFILVTPDPPRLTQGPYDIPIKGASTKLDLAGPFRRPVSPDGRQY